VPSGRADFRLAAEDINAILLKKPLIDRSSATCGCPSHRSICAMMIFIDESSSASTGSSRYCEDRPHIHDFAAVRTVQEFGVRCAIAHIETI